MANKSVLEMDDETMEITSYDGMILWNFDSFMARLIVIAMDDALEYTKHSLYASFHENDEPQIIEDEANRWLNSVMFIREAFEGYTDYSDEDYSMEAEVAKVERVREALPVLGEIYEGLWN